MEISGRIIRKEIAIRKDELILEGMKVGSALNQARKEANIKYGHDWRHKTSISEKLSTKYEEPSIYDDHQFGEHWMD